MTQVRLPQLNPLEQVYACIDWKPPGSIPMPIPSSSWEQSSSGGGDVLERYQTFVNPGRNIPAFIQQLTSITPAQIERAPAFHQVAGQFADFVGDLPIIGHNIKFDLDFLQSHRLDLPNKSYNTWDLASIFLPTVPEYNLAALAQHLGLDHANAHRASADAEVTALVFHKLLEIAAALPAAKIAFIARTARTANATVADLLEGLIPHARGANAILNQGDGGGGVGLNGLNLESLAARVSAENGGLSSNALRRTLTEQQIEELLSADGTFSKSFPVLKPVRSRQRCSRPPRAPSSRAAN